MSHGSSSDLFLGDSRRLAAKEQNLRLRARILRYIRDFFTDRQYLEVETPQLIPAPAPEMYIEAVSAAGSYLHTSPELCMKRLLAAGFSRIFQITHCFRREERGDLHLPEFTLMEWYQTGVDYQALMEECEALLPYLAQQLGRGTILSYKGMKIDLEGPWDRLTVEEAFRRYASLPLDRAIQEQYFDQVLVEDIEPHLGDGRPTFLYDYPAALAALAKTKPGNAAVAERFELYLAGLELANGFSELNDPLEQRERFEAERRQREADGKEVYPIPERFLKALENMPEAAGIALGVDRLVMMFCGASRIDEVVSFTPEDL